MKGEEILLVEDNPDDGLLTVRAPRKNGVSNDVVVARDGAEALDRLIGVGALPNLVLLDLRLPKLNGLEVLRRWRKHDCSRHPHEVRSTTCEGEREELDEVRGPRADFCLPKGMDSERFLREVRRIKSLLVGPDSTSAQERRAPVPSRDTPPASVRASSKLVDKRRSIRCDVYV